MGRLMYPPPSTAAMTQTPQGFADRPFSNRRASETCAGARSGVDLRQDRRSNGLLRDVLTVPANGLHADLLAEKTFGRIGNAGEQSGAGWSANLRAPAAPMIRRG